jgi:hypothetical protein
VCDTLPSLSAPVITHVFYVNSICATDCANLFHKKKFAAWWNCTTYRKLVSKRNRQLRLGARICKFTITIQWSRLYPMLVKTLSRWPMPTFRVVWSSTNLVLTCNLRTTHIVRRQQWVFLQMKVSNSLSMNLIINFWWVLILVPLKSSAVAV